MKNILLLAVTLCFFVSLSTGAQTVEKPYCVVDNYTVTPKITRQCFDTLTEAETYLRTDATPDNLARFLVRDPNVKWLATGFVQIFYRVTPRLPESEHPQFFTTISEGPRRCGGNIVTLPSPAAFQTGCSSEDALKTDILNSSPFNGSGTLTYSNAYSSMPPTSWTALGVDPASGKAHVRVIRNKAPSRKFTAIQGIISRSASVNRYDFYRCPIGYTAKSTVDLPEDPKGVWPYICGSKTSRVITVKSGQYECCTAKDGNPSVATTGNKEYREKLFEWEDQSFSLAYNSINDMPLQSGLSDSWSHTFSERLVFYPINNIINWMRGDGYFEAFTSTDGILHRSRNQAGIVITKETAAIAAVKGQWRLEESNGQIKWFDAGGKLVRIESKQRTLTFSYCSEADYNALLCSKAGLLTSVVSESGRKLDFDYIIKNLVLNVAGDTRPEIRINSIKSDSITRVAFVYNNSAQLVATLFGAAGEIPGRQYLYAETSYLCKDNTGAAIPSCDSAYFPDHLTGVIDENSNRFATYAYDQKGRVTTSKHANDAEVTKLNYITDSTVETTVATGAKKIYTIDAAANIAFKKPTNIAIQDANNNVLSNGSVVYAPDLRVQSSIDANNFRTNFIYDDLHLRSRTQGLTAGGANTSQTRTIQTNWHANFNVPVESKVLNASSNLEARRTYAFNSRGQITAVCEIDPSNTTAMSYTCGSAVYAPVGVRQSTLTYCDSVGGSCPLVGLLLTVDGPRTDVSDVVSLAYRTSDQGTCPATCLYRKGDLWTVTSIVNGISHTTEYSAYDSSGRVLQAKDVNNVVIDMEYNSRGWLTARKVRGTNTSVESDDAITRLEYDQVGQITKIINPDLGFTSFHYDNAHRLDKITDAAGNTVTYVLDELGNRKVETTKDSANAITKSLSRVYDLLGRLLQGKNAAENIIATISYDGNGNLNTNTDALGHVVDQDVDPLNRLKTNIQDVGGINATTQYEYDARDNLTKVIDPKLLNTSYGYNGLNDKTSVASPDTGTKTFTYDNAGNRSTQTDAKGILVNYTYDELNRLRTVVYPTTALNSEFIYDAPNSCIAAESFNKGKLSKFTDPSGTTEYCYDRFGNMTKKIVTNNGATSTFSFAYSLGGYLTSLTYPSSMIVTYVRNNLGQINQVNITQGATTKTFANNITYYPFGPLSKIEFVPPSSGGGALLRSPGGAAASGGGCVPQPGGGCSPPAATTPIVQTRLYDQDYAIQSIGGLDYNVDDHGNIQDSGVGTTFAYDHSDRLKDQININTPVAATAYSYDAVGNRLSKAVNAGAPDQYSYYDGTHRLKRIINGGFERIYDLNGNAIQIDVNKYFTYDERNRMTDFRSSTSTIVSQYQYNAKGERVRKYLGANDQATYLFSETGQLLVESKVDTASNVFTQEIIWLDDMPIGVTSGGDLSAILTDHLNTPRQILRTYNHVTQWRWDATDNAFGEIAATNVSMEFDLRFPGQIYDSESGLHYNHFRDYEPGTGRYMQSDPIGLKGGMSSYSYANSSPINAYDPLGLLAYVCKRGNIVAISLPIRLIPNRDVTDAQIENIFRSQEKFWSGWKGEYYVRLNVYRTDSRREDVQVTHITNDLVSMDTGILSTIDDGDDTWGHEAGHWMGLQFNDLRPRMAGSAMGVLKDGKRSAWEMDINSILMSSYNHKLGKDCGCDE
jgi:RHS repeat-associated protein